MRTVTRRSLAAEDRDLAVLVGTRLRAARHRAGLTQREVAEPRYTKAYVSALENGLIKPSMAALRFLATKLGTTASELLSNADERWERVEAELRLASGDHAAAADVFRTLLDRGPTGAERGLILLGLAEALSRLDQAREAIGLATEARDLLELAGLTEPRQRATYWLASAYHQADNPVQARVLLESLIAEQSSTAAAPESRMRLLIALSMVVTQQGQPKQAIALLEEARALGVDMDDRRRATLLFSLAQSYRDTGDFEAAIRTGIQGLALFQAADAAIESASIENELALIYLQVGNLSEATRLAGEARRQFEGMRDEFYLANVEETEAQIAMARDDLRSAADLASAALDRAERTGNGRAQISALLTSGRIARREGRVDEALASIERAATAARGGPTARLREVLTEWSEVLAETGDHARAYELSREALALD